MALLDPGFNLTLRPMKYPVFYDMYKDAIANTWTVEELDFQKDIQDLHTDKLTDAQSHMIKRLVAFFATGDTIVANNLVLTLYKHLNSPEARMYLSRQLYEEALHIQAYLTLLDNYIPSFDERHQMFAAVENIPSIAQKAAFCDKYTTLAKDLDLSDKLNRKRFIITQACFSACVEGIFFYAAFAYVYWLRSQGLLTGLADLTNWVFRDESMHMRFGFEALSLIRQEEPYLFDDALEFEIRKMLDEAVECELQFAKDMFEGGDIPGFKLADMAMYLEYVKQQRLKDLGYAHAIETVDGHPIKQPFDFLELQGMQTLTNFFARKVSDYQIGVTGEVSLDEEF